MSDAGQKGEIDWIHAENGCCSGGPTVRVPAEFPILDATFVRSNYDLMVVGGDGHRLQVVDYFKWSDPPRLIRTDMEYVGGDFVTRLALHDPGAGGTAVQRAPVVEVETATGRVHIVRDTGEYALVEPGDGVRQGDVLLFSGGRITLRLPDGARLESGTGGRLIVDELHAAGTGDGPSVVLRAEGGTFTFLPSAATPQGAAVVILTPAARIGPARSAFAFRHNADEGLRAWLQEDPGTAPVLVENQAGRVELDAAGARVNVAGPDRPPELLPAEGTDAPPENSAAESVETGLEEASPGGDENALPGDPIVVTGQVDPFDLLPDAAPLPAAPTGVLQQSSTLPSGPRRLTEEVLLQFRDSPNGGTQQSAGPTKKFLRDWDQEPGGGSWEVKGDADVFGAVPEASPLNTRRPITPEEGRHMAVLQPAQAELGEIDSFLGLPSGSVLQAVADTQIAAGSAIKRTMTLNAGSELSFDWFFDAGNETARRDFALFTIDGRIIKLADSEGTGIGGATGWRTFVYTVPTTKTVTVGFAVFNDLVPDGPSRLMVDNVRIGRTFDDSYVPVPEDSGPGWRVLVQKPLVGDDALATSEDGRAATTALALLANDMDPDPFDAMGLAGIIRTRTDGTGTVGRVTFSSTGEVVYDAAGRFDQLSAGETTTDEFRYEVDAGNGTRNFGTVRVTIVGVNDAPTAGLDKATASTDGSVTTINVLANDDDVDSDDDRASLRVVGASSASGAPVDIAGVPGGGIVYRPDGRFTYLAAGESTVDRVTYTIEDRHGARASGIAEVKVEGVNDAPSAADDRASAAEDTPVVFDPVANDRDPDLSDRLRVVAVEGQSVVAGSRIGLASGASVILAADGRLVYDPSGRFDRLAEGEVLTETFRYRIGDGHGGTAEASATVSITGRNDAPAAMLDAAAAAEDGPAIRIDALANDDDPDSDDDHASLRIVAASAASGAAVTFSGLPGEGLVYAAAGHFEALAEGETGLDTITYVIDDRHGAQSTATIRVTVSGANDTPIAAHDQRTVSEDAGGTLAVLDNDHDPDVTDRLRVLAIDGRSVAPGGQVVLASGAVVTLAVDGTLAYDPAGRFEALSMAQNVTDEFRYTAGDGHGGVSEVTATVTIEGRNDAPTLRTDSGEALEDGPAVLIDVLANDDDPDGDDDRSSLRIVAAQARSGATVTFTGAAGAGLSYNPAGRFDFVGAGETGTDIITYTVEDRHGARSTASVTVTITGANDAPLVQNDLLMIDANSVLSLPPAGILGNDREPDASDRLRIIAVNGIAADVGRTVTLASGALLTIDGDGNLIYDPNGQFDGLTDFERETDSFEYTVSDTHGSTATALATVQIQGRNDPPQAGADASVTDQNSAVRIRVLFNDSDPDAGGNLRVLSVDTNGSRGIVRMNPDGTLTYDPNGAFDDLQAGEAASDTFGYVLDDFVGGRSTATVTVTVVGVTRPQASRQELLQSFEVLPLAGDDLLGTLETPARIPLEQGGAFVATHLATMAALTTTGDDVAGLERFLSEDVRVGGQSLVRLPVDPIGGSSPHSGSALRSAVTLGAGDVVNGRIMVTFDWNFVSGDANAGATNINDFAVLTLTDGQTAQVLRLEDSRATTGVSNGWRTTAVDVTAFFSLPTVGNLRVLLGWAVVNDETPGSPSQLLIDNIRLNRPIGSDFQMIRSEFGGSIVTYRQRPEASDDVVSVSAGGTINEDVPAILEASGLLGNDRPSAGVTAATLRLVGVDATGSRGLVNLIDGRITYDPHGRFDELAAGESGSDQFLYVASDANGGSSIGRATIIVAGINDAPTATPDTATMAEHGGAVAVDVLGNDDDVDRDDDRSTLRIVAAGSTTGAAVSFSGLAGAGLVYDPRGIPSFAGLSDGETTSDSIFYTVEDRHGARSTGIVAVTITGVNDAPSATVDQAATDEDAPVTIAVLGNDSDPDLRDRLSVGAINGTLVGPGAQVALASGAIVFVNADGTVRYDPGAAFASLARGQTSSDSFVYSAADGHGGSSQATVSVSIAGRNDAPVAAPDTVATDAATRLTVAAATLLSNDHDPDSGDSVHLLDLDVTGTLGTVTFDGTSIHYDPAGRFRSLGAGETLNDSFAYRVADTDGATATGRVTVAVQGINDAPEAVDDVKTTDEDTKIRISVLDNDDDPDDHDALSLVSVDTTGTRGSVSINPDGTIDYDPSGRFDQLESGQSQQDTFRYRISDGHGGTDEAQVTVTVDGRSDTERLVDSFESPFAPENRTTTAVTTTGSYQETDGSRGLYAPTDGQYMARLEASGTTAQKVGQETVSKLEAFLGLPDRSLPRDPVDATFPANGSAFKLKVNVVAGDQLSFDWMFDARDILPDNDYAAFTVVGDGAPQIFKLSDVRQTGSGGASGWRTSIYTASASGELTVGLAVVNDRSATPATENSYLLVDNVRLNKDFGASYQSTESGHSGPFETIQLV